MNAPVWKSMTIANLGWGTIDLLHYDSTDSDDKDNYITHKRKSKIMTNTMTKRKQIGRKVSLS